ncbi:hypothetical protein QQ008_11050 [Fulvivirgaceae bacterium BMA10]|uniref:Uncharacterized protein n=1 Tax=Splendidivirga corallicola TaxID=3051826 RepID=A0ABT8KMF4_9BACT|nr:hypothetical protein [Fulvivirgaceae bacterium BMA10]
MKKRHILLKVSFVLLLIVAIFHTYFILIGGPPFPSTPDFIKMQELMRSVEFDTGGNVNRTMQNIMDGFNIVVSIFLFTLPLLNWTMLYEIRNNSAAVRKLTIINLAAIGAFSLTSFMLLAIGGTVIGGLICLLLVISLIKSI